MKVHIMESSEAIAAQVASQIISEVQNNYNCVLGLATGSSVIGIYEQLVKDHIKNRTSYKGVKTFNLDEYCGISSLRCQSFCSFMNEKLFKYIDINKNNIYIPNGNSGNLNAECDKYEQLIKDSPIDIQVLGIGANGHIGFNEPGTSFESSTHIIKLHDKTREDNSRFFSCMSEVPAKAITMGIKTILSAKRIILVAMGESKAKAVKQMIEGSLSTECPASALQTHPNAHIYLDTAAAKLLKQKIYIY